MKMCFLKMFLIVRVIHNVRHTGNCQVFLEFINLPQFQRVGERFYLFLRYFMDDLQVSYYWVERKEIKQNLTSIYLYVYEVAFINYVTLKLQIVLCTG